MNFWISFVAGNTLADCNMTCCITQCIDSTWFFVASIHTRSGFSSAIFVISAFIITGTARWLFCYWCYCTTSIWCYSVAVFGWACASSTLINNESTFKCTHATSILVDLKSIFNATWNAITICINSRAWRTYTVTIDIPYESFVLWTRYN